MLAVAVVAAEAPPSSAAFVAVVALPAVVAEVAVAALPLILMLYVPLRAPEGTVPLIKLLAFSAELAVNLLAKSLVKFVTCDSVTEPLIEAALPVILPTILLPDKEVIQLGSA